MEHQHEGLYYPVSLFSWYLHFLIKHPFNCRNHSSPIISSPLDALQITLEPQPPRGARGLRACFKTLAEAEDVVFESLYNAKFENARKILSI